MQELTKILDLHDRLYQDVWIDGKQIRDGDRDCKGRLDMILPRIPKNAVVLDIGSNIGHFSAEIARHRPDVLVVGIEESEHSCLIASHVCRVQNLHNVIILNQKLDLNTLKFWWRTAEMFDVAMMLSVMHHIPADDVLEYLALLKHKAFNFIFEMSPHADQGAGGRNTTALIGDHDKFFENHYGAYRTEKIGEVKSLASFSPVKRPVYHLRDSNRVRHFNKSCIMKSMNVEYDGDISLEAVAKAPFRFTLDGGKDPWTLRNSDRDETHDWFPGVNLQTMLHFGMVWPDRNALCEQIQRKATEQKPYDLGCWNVIMTASGPRIIDGEKQPGKGREFSEARLEIMRSQIMGESDLDILFVSE